LVPGGGDAQELAGFEVGAPELKEEGELAYALLDGQCAELDSSVLVRSVDDGFGRITVVTTFGEDATGRFALNRFEVRGSQVANRQRVADARKIYRMVERPAFVALEGASGDDGGFSVTVFGKGSEGAFLRAGWLLVDSKGFVGRVCTEGFESIKGRTVARLNADSRP
jgi:hypothetical protein